MVVRAKERASRTASSPSQVIELRFSRGRFCVLELVNDRVMVQLSLFSLPAGELSARAVRATQGGRACPRLAAPLHHRGSTRRRHPRTRSAPAQLALLDSHRVQPRPRRRPSPLHLPRFLIMQGVVGELPLQPPATYDGADLRVKITELSKDGHVQFILDGVHLGSVPPPRPLPLSRSDLS